METLNYYPVDTDVFVIVECKVFPAKITKVEFQEISKLYSNSVASEPQNRFRYCYNISGKVDNNRVCDQCDIFVTKEEAEIKCKDMIKKQINNDLMFYQNKVNMLKKELENL